MISVIIITRNEESNIKRCLNSVIPISDDVIVVDSGSSDRTISLARTSGAKVISKQWMGYGATKNYGHSKAKYNWILSIDADEALSKELQKSIRVLSPNIKDVYAIRRKNFYCGVEMKLGHLKPEWKVRLFNKQAVEWDNRTVHEQLKIESSLSTVKLTGDIDHYVCATAKEFEDRCIHFAELGAAEWMKLGYSPNYLKVKFGSTFHFIRSFIMQGGFVHGNIGFEISKVVASAFRHKVSHYLNSGSKD